MKMNNATVFSLVLSPGATWFSRNSVNLKITSDTVYDKLRTDWAEKFRTVDKEEDIRSMPETAGEERQEKNEIGRSPQCNDLQTGWALLKRTCTFSYRG